MATKASVALTLESDDDTSTYYDYLLVGRTGTGKSTTANKLIGVDPATNSLLTGGVLQNIIKQWGGKAVDGIRYFATGGGIESVTTNCEVRSNESNKNRVLDTPGFADSRTAQRYGVLRSNLQIFRWILRQQRAHNLQFSRVLYFYPTRGPPERAEGTLQEEIKVMYNYFGQKIFDIMVIIATNKMKFQKHPFSKENIEKTQVVFMMAYEKATGQVLPACPPVVYLAYREDNVQDLVVGAKVIAEEELFFSPEYPKVRTHIREGQEPPIQLSIDMSQEDIQASIREHRGKVFHFQDRCTRCAVKIVQEVLPSGEEISVQVIFENGDEEEYDNSYCHPIFIPKYSQLAKFAGGIAHIVTLGSALVVERVFGTKTWPGFTNSDEVCPICNNFPGSDGCSPVGQLAEFDGGSIETNHSKTLDKIIEIK